MINYANTYRYLPPYFYHQGQAENFSRPELIALNQQLADELNLPLSHLNAGELAKYFSGQSSHPGLEPIALAYCGHQFGHFNPTLGDGRALLLGEIVTSEGKRFDLQLKGSGRTIYSRSGDGLSAIGPVIREYLVSEAMHQLGVPTTRALCAVATNELVYREEALPGAILTRVAASHIRIGTFEFAAAKQDHMGLKQLADYTIERHYPEAKQSHQPYLTLMDLCAQNWAKMVAKWMSLGFIHGVMNTDNMLVCGQTIDYGPCAFMDHFKFNQVYSFIDRHGRYAYNNQIPIAKWNLARFASALLPLLDSVAQAQAYMEQLFAYYDQAWLSEMSKKFGIVENPDATFITDFLTLLEKHNLDFTNSFRAITDDVAALDQYEGFKAWRARWHERDQALMKAHNPVIIPRNHQVEKAIQLAQQKDYSYFERLHEAFKTPFAVKKENEDLTLAPTSIQVVKNTFCGT